MDLQAAEEAIRILRNLRREEYRRTNQELSVGTGFLYGAECHIKSWIREYLTGK